MTRFLPSRNLMVAMVLSAIVLLLATPTMHSAGQVFALADSGGSPANATTETTDGKGGKLSCNDVETAKGGVFLGRIIPCLLHTIETSTQTFSAAMIDWLMPLFWAFLTFVVTMFGLKVLQNEGQLQAQAILLVLKIGLVLGVLNLIPGTLVPMSYAIMDESQAVVMGILDGDSASLNCKVDRYDGNGNIPAIWAQLDCLMGQLYGYATGTPDADGNARPNMLLASSVFGLLGGFFFGGSFGVALFFVCVGILVSMFMLIIRVVMGIVNCYLVIALYMIIAPLFLPLILLRATAGYFEKWWGAILAAFLLPLMITTYVMVALQMYDALMFSKDSLMNKLLSNDFIKNAQELPEEACSKYLTNDPADRAKWTGQTEKVLNANPFLKIPQQLMLSGGNNVCGGLQKTSLKLENLKDKGEAFETQKKAFTALFRDAIKLLLLIWLIDAGYKSMLSAIRPMLGSYSVAGVMDMRSPMEQRFQSGVAVARQSFEGRFRGDQSTNYESPGGTEFLKRVPLGMKDAATGFFDGIKKDKG